MTPRLSLLLATAILLPVFVGASQPASPSLVQDSSAQGAQDFRDQLPRTTAKSPAESLAEFELVDGFSVQTVAAEPLIADPIAIDFDAAGRAYVVCMRGYSEQDDQQLGEVRLLEDTDADGAFDTSIVFASGLSWPTAITCWDGGVFIGAAPDILYCKDKNGDGIADIRRTVFRGFSKDNVQGLLNSFRWGLDNRIHVAVSTSGATVRRMMTALDGAEITAAQQSFVLRGRDFSFEPRTLEIEIESGGGQHGMSFDDWGRKYVTSNSNHIQQVVMADRYLRRNLQLPPTDPTAMIAADGPQAEVFRISPVEPWRILRTRLRVAGEVPGPIEGGGRAAGYFTGATGVTIYRGDAWPPESRGLAFIGDVGSNIVHRKRLTSEYADAQHVQRLAERIDPQREFLASKEIWFRPVQFANAPDGTLWVLDMYREVIEHPKSLPPSIKQHLDLTSGRDRGRIYRIAPQGFQHAPLPMLDLATAAELVPYLQHANAWQRETAARRLFALQDASAVPALQKLVRDNASPWGQVHALWTLHGLQALQLSDLEFALQSSQSEVRWNAVRLCETFLRSDDANQREQALATLSGLTSDADLEVRYQLALSLGELPDAAQRLPGLLAILRQDAQDPWVRLAVLTSTGGIAGEAFMTFAKDDAFSRQPEAAQLLTALADQVAADRQALPKVFSWLLTEWATHPDAVTEYVQRLAPRLGRTNSEIRAAFHESESGAQLYSILVDNSRRGLRGNAATAQQAVRLRGARLLWLAEWDDVASHYARLLTPRESPQVRAAALAALERVENPDAARLILKAWTSLTPNLRTLAEGVLYSRPSSTIAALDQIQAHELDPADFSPEFARRLNIHPDKTIQSRAAELFGTTATSARDDVIAEYQAALETAGDAVRGRKIFEQNCAKCHRRAGVGHEIGPSLEDTAAKTREQLMMSVLDPNREVNPAYINYVASTEDGRVLTGIIAAESVGGITLKREEGQTQTVQRDELDVFSSTGKSIMPEGLEKEFDVQGLADLLEFLTARPEDSGGP